MKKKKLSDIAYEISGKNALALIKSGNATLRNDLRSDINDDLIDYYLLKDGQLLLYFKYEPSGVVYISYEAQVKMIKELEQKWAKRFPGKKLTDGAEQIDHYHFKEADLNQLVKASPAKLALKLSLDIKVLDYSVKSLNKLSEGINKVLDGIARDDAFDNIGEELTLYFGETMRININGEWSVSSDENGKLKTLLITDPIQKDKKYKPYEMLLTEFFEYDTPVNLKNDYDIELRNYLSNKNVNK